MTWVMANTTCPLVGCRSLIIGEVRGGVDRDTIDANVVQALSANGLWNRRDNRALVFSSVLRAYEP